MEFTIKHTWNGLPVSHEPTTLVLPSPAPLGEPGKAFRRLWDYEVVEAFFLNDRTGQYLEVEHLLLLLSCKKLHLEFEVTRMKTKWEGKAHLPWNHFPPFSNKFNAFAIHGSGEERKYEVLCPVPRHELQEGRKPDL
uniref:Chromosome 4 open reading frame 33 n=1 Tax=Strigops habroptila TaxID=2489341 RepID=A0A672V6X6_STRHB